MSTILIALPEFYPEQTTPLLCGTATGAVAGGAVNAASAKAYSVLAGEISTIREDNVNSGFLEEGSMVSGTAAISLSRGSGV